MRVHPYEQRVKRLLASLEDEHLDGLLLQSADHRRYFLATGVAGVALVTRAQNYLITHFVDLAEARQQAQGCQVVRWGGEDRRSLTSVAAGLVQESRLRRVGYEARVMSHADFQALSEAFTGVWLVPADDLLADLRAVKTSEEIIAFERAGAIDDAAFEHVLSVIRPGVTELEVAAELERFIRSHGVERFSFGTIVVSGPRTAFCHGTPSSRAIKAGDLVTMDYGAVWDGCASDLTRTVAVGYATEKAREVYEAVQKAQELALAAARPGITGEELDRVARQHIEAAGYGSCFGHGLGHSLNYGPRAAPGAKVELRPGHVLTVEPGIYLEGWGGVRIEDDIVLTADGCRLLTHAPRELIVI